MARSEKPAMPAGVAMMSAPENCAGFGWGGQFYETDENGVVTIPIGAVEESRSHQFRDVAVVEAEKQAKSDAMAAKDVRIAELEAKLAALAVPTAAAPAKNSK